jgi:hypothetical protein
MVTLTEKVKGLNPTDILLTGLFLGVLAGVSGVAGWVDSNLTGRALGFDRRLPKTQTVVRGAALGSIASLPLAYLSATSGASSLGGIPYNANVRSVFVNPMLASEEIPPPKDYIYAKSNDGGQYLIIDPKYNL